MPAGFDRFDPGVMEHYFRGYAQQLGICFDELMRYGRDNPDDPGSQFNMANLAARHSSYANGVSRLHGEVTRQMAHPVWSGYPPVSYTHLDVYKRQARPPTTIGSG